MSLPSANWNYPTAVKVGAGRVRELSQWCKSLGMRKPLLITDPGLASLPLINDVQGHRITDQIKALRRQLATEMGFVMPSVRILDNMQLDANTYVIKIKEVEAGSGKVWHGQFMVMDPTGNQVTLPGTPT